MLAYIDNIYIKGHSTLSAILFKLNQVSSEYVSDFWGEIILILRQHRWPDEIIFTDGATCVILYLFLSHNAPLTEKGKMAVMQRKISLAGKMLSDEQSSQSYPSSKVPAARWGVSAPVWDVTCRIPTEAELVEAVQTYLDVGWRVFKSQQHISVHSTRRIPWSYLNKFK